MRAVTLLPIAVACQPAVALDGPGLDGLWPAGVHTVVDVLTTYDGDTVRHRANATWGPRTPETFLGPAPEDCVRIHDDAPLGPPVTHASLDVTSLFDAPDLAPATCHARWCDLRSQQSFTTRWAIQGDVAGVSEFFISPALTLPREAPTLDAPAVARRDDGRFQVRWDAVRDSRIVAEIRPVAWSTTFDSHVRCVVPDDGSLSIDPAQFDAVYARYDSLWITVRRERVAVHDLGGGGVLVATGGRQDQITVTVR